MFKLWLKTSTKKNQDEYTSNQENRKEGWNCLFNFYVIGGAPTYTKSYMIGSELYTTPKTKIIVAHLREASSWNTA